MKNKIVCILALAPLLISCGGPTSEPKSIVDEDYVPTLPTFKDKNSGAILEDEENVYFDFYEISDFHGATEYDKDDNKLGIERMSTYFDNKRTANPGGTFLLSGGDMWQGTADSNITRGNLVTYVMDVMDFDAMTLGNHEFDWTEKWIKNNEEKATFPFLCANLLDKRTNELADFVSPSTIVTRGDYKVGIIGTIGDNIKSAILASAVENFDFTNEIAAVKSESAKLKEAGCDLVVWSSHNDVTYLKNEISSEDLGVNLIFGGHSHNTIVDEVNGIPMLESKNYGRSIPHVQLKLNKTTKAVTPVEGYGCDTTPTATEYSADADVTGIYNQYKSLYIDPLKNIKIGHTSSDLSASEHLPNLAVKAMFENIKTDYSNYDIKAAFTNVNGGVRADVKAGDINYGDIYSAFPFDNELVILSTTGRKLQNYTGGNGISNFAQYQVVGSYGALVSTEKYYFVSTDYLASNDSYFSSCELVAHTGIIIRDCVAEAIKALGNVDANAFKTSSDSHFQKIS